MIELHKKRSWTHTFIVIKRDDMALEGRPGDGLAWFDMIPMKEGWEN